MLCSIGSPSSIPRRLIRPLTRSVPKIRIRSSSRRQDRTGRGAGVALTARARPRSWLSIRLDSWRSVPRMCRPPAASTSSFSPTQSSRSGPGTSLVVLGFDFGIGFGTGQPLGVAAEHDVGAAAGHVGRDRDGGLTRPAWATIDASRSWYLALSTTWGHPALEHGREHLRLSRSRSCRPGRAGRAHAVRDLVRPRFHFSLCRPVDLVGAIVARSSAGWSPSRRRRDRRSHRTRSASVSAVPVMPASFSYIRK